MKYFRPSTVNEVVSGLAAGGVALAGGTLLVPSLASQPDTGVTLWDLQQLSDLRRITAEPQFIRVGALVSLDALHSSPLIATEYAALAEAALAVGNPHVRDAGTVGGNLASPGTDLPPSLLVLGAEVVEAKSSGEVVQPVQQFLANGAHGLITEVRLPRQAQRSRFIKYSLRAASGRTIASVAGALTLNEGKIAGIKIACGGISPKAERLLTVEQMLLGQAPAEPLFKESARTGAAQVTVNAVQPPGEQYRRHLVEAGILQMLRDIATA
ncbi:MAG TPA: FAD binding domain-containing protein [Candidatus Angelobacter sp.]|nr:FAD binding domain-containing protein [Candidatus Angelobacter sp.]